MNWRNLAATAAVASTSFWLGTLVPREFPRVANKPIWRTLFPPPPPKPFVPPPPPLPKTVSVTPPPVAALPSKPLPKPAIPDFLPKLSKWRIGEGHTLEHLDAKGWNRQPVDGTIIQLEDRDSEIEIGLADGTRLLSRDQGRTWQKMPL